MLCILTGRAGSGKTAQVLARMKQEGPHRPQLLVVPEQASFEMEVRLCRENGNGAGAYGEVLSFTRLENRVLAQTGGAARPVLDEGGRLLVMYAALRAVQANLTVYAMPSQKPRPVRSVFEKIRNVPHTSISTRSAFASLPFTGRSQATNTAMYKSMGAST